MGNLSNTLRLGSLGKGMGSHWEYREDGSIEIHWHNGEVIEVPAGENPYRRAAAYLRGYSTNQRVMEKIRKRYKGGV